MRCGAPPQPARAALQGQGRPAARLVRAPVSRCAAAIFAACVVTRCHSCAAGDVTLVAISCSISPSRVSACLTRCVAAVCFSATSASACALVGDAPRAFGECGCISRPRRAAATSGMPRRALAICCSSLLVSATWSSSVVWRWFATSASRTRLTVVAVERVLRRQRLLLGARLRPRGPRGPPRQSAPRSPSRHLRASRRGGPGAGRSSDSSPVAAAASASDRASRAAFWAATSVARAVASS